MQVNVGEIVDGKVTGITAFGAFVEIGEGVTGMVHISEVSHKYITDIKEVLKVNDKVKVKILNVSDDNKISLSIKTEVVFPLTPVTSIFKISSPQSLRISRTAS